MTNINQELDNPACRCQKAQLRRDELTTRSRTGPEVEEEKQTKYPYITSLQHLFCFHHNTSSLWLRVSLSLQSQGHRFPKCNENHGQICSAQPQRKQIEQCPPFLGCAHSDSGSNKGTNKQTCTVHGMNKSQPAMGSLHARYKGIGVRILIRLPKTRYEEGQCK